MKNKSIVENTLNQLKNLFYEDFVCSIAYKYGFIQRSSSKLCPMAFLIVMVVEMSLIGTHSLNIMCELLCLHGSLKITAQALSLRLNNATTVRFLKSAYSRVLSTKLARTNFELQEKGILERFRAIYIEDSTSCRLHEKVAGSFKGCGGKASKAGYKIHVIWNAAKNCVKRLHITPSNMPDSSQSFKIIRLLKRGDLVLRDLGYFSLECFKKIVEKGAFFLTRLKWGVNVYSLEGELIEDLTRYVEQRIQHSTSTEILVLLGKERLLVRLLAYAVPQSVYDKRVRKLRRKGQKRGQTVSKSLLRFNRYTFLITNISEKLLSKEEAYTLYKLRWEIELLFKSFKSDFQVDMIKGKSKHRVECFIIAKLIAIMITIFLFSYRSIEAFAQERELSFTKFSRWILAHRYLLMLFRPESLKYEVIKMKNVDILILCKQKRSRKTTRELLESETTFDDLYPKTHPKSLETTLLSH